MENLNENIRKCDKCIYFTHKTIEVVIFGQFEYKITMYCKKKEKRIDGTIPTALNCNEYVLKTKKIKVEVIMMCADCGYIIKDEYRDWYMHGFSFSVIQCPKCDSLNNIITLIREK